MAAFGLPPLGPSPGRARTRPPSPRGARRRSRWAVGRGCAGNGAGRLLGRPRERPPVRAGGGRPLIPYEISPRGCAEAARSAGAGGPCGRYVRVTRQSYGVNCVLNMRRRGRFSWWDGVGRALAPHGRRLGAAAVRWGRAGARCGTRHLAGIGRRTTASVGLAGALIIAVRTTGTAPQRRSHEHHGPAPVRPGTRGSTRSHQGRPAPRVHDGRHSGPASGAGHRTAGPAGPDDGRDLRGRGPAGAGAGGRPRDLLADLPPQGAGAAGTAAGALPRARRRHGRRQQPGRGGRAARLGAGAGRGRGVRGVPAGPRASAPRARRRRLGGAAVDGREREGDRRGPRPDRPHRRQRGRGPGRRAGTARAGPRRAAALSAIDIPRTPHEPDSDRARQRGEIRGTPTEPATRLLG